jgi:hypothetical protein
LTATQGIAGFLLDKIMSRNDLACELEDLIGRLKSFNASTAKARDWAEIADQCMYFQENIADSITELDRQDKMELL